MTNRERYQKTFGALHASRQQLEELTMKETKRNFHMPKLLVIAACLVALLATTAFAANEVTDGALAEQIICFINGEAVDLSAALEQDGVTTYTDGDVEITVDNESGADYDAVTVTIEGGEDANVEVILPDAEAAP